MCSFLGWWLIWEGSAYCGLCHHLSVGPELSGKQSRKAMKSNSISNISPRTPVKSLPPVSFSWLPPVLTSFPGKLSPVKVKWTFCSWSCVGHAVYHSNSKETKTNIGTRELAVAVIDMIMLLLEDCKEFWRLVMKRPCVSRAYWVL